MDNEQKLKAVWMQRQIPVILRRSGEGEMIRLRIPFRDGNMDWLRNDKKRKPKWIKEHNYWEVPKAWFNDLVDRGVKRFGKIYVIQPYREQEKCAPACMNAKGHDCQCSCMGVNHGHGQHGSWLVASEAFAARYGEQMLACRLMSLKDGHVVETAVAQVPIKKKRYFGAKR